MQNGKSFLKFAQDVIYQHHNYSLKMLLKVIIFTTVMLLYYMNVTAAKEDGLCEHHPKYTEECGYTEENPESSCEFVCEICEKDSEEEQTVISWSWDSDELVWDDSANLWYLALPGANEENKMTRKLLKELLPGEIHAKMEDDSEKILKLSWDLEDFPKEGAFEGSHMLTAGIPEGYVLEESAAALEVLAELGGGDSYLGARPGDKFVSSWSYVSRGGSEIEENSVTYEYSMDYYLAMTSDHDLLVQKIKSVLPTRIRCSGYNTGNELVNAGFTIDGAHSTGGVSGFVNINWTNIEDIINDAGAIKENTSLTFEAMPVSNPGYCIRVNSNDSNLAEDSNDTAEITGILNLTITLHDLHLEDHIVSSANPPGTVVNLFDYWVDKDGANDNDLLPKNDWTHMGSTGNPRGHTGVQDWNQGINTGRLLLFGDGNIHAGFWNKGAGSSSDYGKDKAGMSGIVKSVLQEGYPVMNEEDMAKQIANHTGISDWDLCGDHDDANLKSVDPKNISNTVNDSWKAAGNSASLDYLFDPEIENSYKRSYKDVKGLFQIDNNGYYYYNMRQNFAEYHEDSNRFILYDGPAVDRTDKNDDGSRSVGNFFPFNTGEQVFDLVENGKLSGNQNIISNNEKTTAGFMNHHLGMTVNVDFRQPLNGVVNTGTSNNEPMTFQFSGDDDVWIFIDDVLVLDLGGIHSEIYGMIDFSTGNVAVGQSWKSNGIPFDDKGNVDVDKLPAPVETTTLKAQFDKAGKSDDTLWRGNTFASNTGHTLKMFYLERGNYDSSLALRFNLQPLLYQQLKKVDQDGNPLEGVEFDLCPAEETTAGASGAIECLYTDNALNHGQEFYVKQKEGSAYVHLRTASDGTAQFLDENGNYFNFADQGHQFYILKETKAPNGYRSLPVDIVLYYDPDTSMISVANRWSTGAYACSVMNNLGTGRLTYGHFQEDTGEIVQDTNKTVSTKRQEEGLVVAIPMLMRQSDQTWEALYGSNLKGFQSSSVRENADVGAWRDAVLRAVLEQAADSENPSWYLSWDSDNMRLIGRLSDLPGLANRYQLINPDGDMRIIYGIVESKALQAMGINGADAEERYEELGSYIKKNGTEKTLEAIMNVTVDDSGSGRGFSFLDASHISRDFRSLVYIPNEQRELWVMKVDQNGKPRNGAQFGLYNHADCTGEPIAKGSTATVNGQEGTLIFSPSNDQSAGHAQMIWESYTRTHYYLKELSAPQGCTLNSTIIPVVVGTYSIYADAGTRNDGVSVLAGVGKLTQTMRQYAMNSNVDITLQDITAIQQYQSSRNTEVFNKDWKDAKLEGTSDVKRSLNLHFGRNAVVDYGLHDEDGGKLFKPFFVADTGYVRARVVQNYEALVTPIYENSKLDANKDNLGDTDLTNLFSLLNIVVVTDNTEKDTSTGRLTVSKMLSGSQIDRKDYTRNFTFTIRLTDEEGKELTGEYYFYGTDKAGYISSGKSFPLHHDESITILGLPAGTKYTVTETSIPGWYPLPESGEVNGDIIKDATSFATFYNSKEPWPDIGFLRIQKVVAGSGDRTKGFTFYVTLRDEKGRPLEEEFSYTGDKKGKISSGQSISLCHDQQIMILNLPVGTQYVISEKEANQEGYVTSFRGEKGSIVSKEIGMAFFVNTKETEKTPDDPAPNPGLPSGPEPESPSTPNPEPNVPSTPDAGAGKGYGSDKDSGTWKMPKVGDPITLIGILGVMALSGIGAAASAMKRKTKTLHKKRPLRLHRRKLRQRRKRPGKKGLQLYKKDR